MEELLIVEVSLLTAVLASCFVSFLFVASLYLWSLLGYEGNRNEPGTIKRRFVSACLSCVCSAALVRSLARPAASGELGLTLLELLGLGTADLVRATCCCLGLTTLIFAGPIVQHFIFVVKYKRPLVAWHARHPWMAARDYIMAPITEEFTFRACVVRLWVAASIPQAAIIFLSPLCFALAHAHHIVEHYRRERNKKAACMQVAFQLFYTSIFGTFSNFLLLRTGSTVAVILAHTFCNIQGFPDLEFLVSRRNLLHKYRAWLGATYIIGIVMFSALLFRLTSGFASTFVPPGIRASLP
eukprot:TRINITY_DN6401_c0_g3_i1.p1 TRINITY_DN6401_c0_g3~~TRINITY_DN6401_c0_g3_i1.p1  ORF type:complete len:305 (+),score=35.81 TRINITY_DN6401_c0_g3_i1:22-915(+)